MFPGHNQYNSKAFLRAYDGLPDTSNALFTGSGVCAGCHGHDQAGLANVSSAGEDVNPTDQWMSSLMGNSAKDPFWRAKVAHEVAINPDHQLELEDKCTSCHAPPTTDDGQSVVEAGIATGDDPCSVIPWALCGY
mgnify:CR=1 FL=1